MKIYTKTGDKGETSLLGGKRVSKSCLEMQVIGEVDELNASLGVVVALLRTVNCHPERALKGDEGSSSGLFVGEQNRDPSSAAKAASLGMTVLGNFIQNIQRDLFKVGAELAALQGPLEDKIEKIDSVRVGEMEVFIDQFWGQLPELKNFILPGGSLAGAQLHQARTICRRAERQLVDFAKTTPIRSELSIYINRLSDFLFATARWVNYKEGAEEIVV